MEQKETDFFLDIVDMLKDTEFLTLPSIPDVEYKEDGIKYKVSDLSLLNPIGVKAVEDVINYAANHKDAEEVYFEIPSEMSQEERDIATSIAVGFSYRAEKRGKWIVAGRLLQGWTTCKHQGKEYIIFYLTESAARSIFQLAEKQRAEMRYKLGIKEIVRQCVSDSVNS